jgi:hypothetical protein
VGGPSRRRSRFRDRVLAPHIPIGSISGAPEAGVLENKLVILGGRYWLRLFSLYTYSFGVELSCIIRIYRASGRPVRYKHLSVRQQHDVDSLPSVAVECDDKQVVQGSMALLVRISVCGAIVTASVRYPA